MRERHGDARFEHRRIAGVAAGQFAPRDQRQARLFARRRGPAESEQGLVGVQAVEAHALEQAAGVVGAFVLQRGDAEREVGAVAQAALLFVAGRRAADFVEQGGAAGHVAALDQGHTEVEARERTGLLGVAGHRAEHAGGAGEVTARHQQLRLQQVTLFEQGRGQPAFDAGQRRLGLRH